MFNLRSAFLIAMLCLFFFSLLLIGCQEDNTGSEVTDPNILLEFNVSGGFSGFDEQLVINKDGSGRLIQPTNEIEFQLKDSELAMLRAEIDSIAFDDLKSRYSSREKVDNMAYVIAHEGNRIQVDDGAEPPELSSLIVTLNGIIIKVIESSL